MIKHLLTRIYAGLNQSWWGILSLLGLHLLLLLTTQFTAWPEMLIYPTLLEKGFNFYGDIIQPYFPTLPYMLWGWYRLFGFSIFSLQLFTWSLLLVSDVLLLLWLRYLKQPVFLPGLIFILSQFLFEGNGLWFDVATVPFLIGSAWCWTVFQQKRVNKYAIWCGLLLGFAVLIKQTAVWFIVFILVQAILNKQTKVGFMIVGWSVVLMLTLLIFFDPRTVWEWSIKLPFFGMSKTPSFVLYPTLRQLVTSGFVFLPLIFSIKQNREWLGWTSAGLMLVMPRFAFFHLQAALPFLVLLLANKMAKKWNMRLKAFMLVYVCVLVGLVAKTWFTTERMPPRFFEPAVYEAGKELRTYTTELDETFFYNDMGNVMWASQLVPIKPWAANFPWYMEIPGLQNRIVASIEQNKVSWVVMSPYGNEGQYVPGSYVASVIDAYLKQNYAFHTKLNDQLHLLKRHPQAE